MEIRLDLSTEQLAYLDKDLTVLLKELTDEQKIEILKAYMINKFEHWETKNSWGNTVLTDFAKEIVNGLQKKICDAITEDVLQDENLKKAMKEVTEQVKKELGYTIEAGIINYIVSNLFNNKKDIEEMVYPRIWDSISSHMSQYHSRY